GHHRTSLAHAAYLIRHRGCSAEAAWAEVAGLPWTRPGAAADKSDKGLIEDFARAQQFLSREAGQASREVDDDEDDTIAAKRPVDHRDGGCAGDHRPDLRGVGPGDFQFRPGSARPDLSIGPDARDGSRTDAAHPPDQDRLELARL